MMKILKKFLSKKIKVKIRHVLRTLEFKFINDSNAVTFQEKIKLRIKKSSQPSIGKRMSMYADKYKVRSYVSEKIGSKYLIDLIFVGTSLTDNLWQELPERFVIKTNFGSGPEHYHIVKNKNNESLITLKEKFNRALHDDWFLPSLEMAYSYIDRKIIIETYMEGLDGFTSPDDYKIHSFKDCDGNVSFLTQIDRGRFETLERNFYDNDLNLLNLYYGGVDNFEFDIDKKKLIIKEMHKLASILLGELTYARVDFYYINNQIYFGEITHTHTGGYALFTPESASKWLGGLIKTNEIFAS